MRSNSIRNRTVRLHCEELEPRQLLSGYQPTASEQFFLERLNDARANPAAYGAAIGVDLTYIAASEPLAFDSRLIEAARMHSQDMNDRAYFAHNTPEGVDPGTRMTNAGFPYTTWAESIAAGVPFSDPAEALKALVIDTGIPNLGHRNHLLANGSPYTLQTQVGVGGVLNSTGPYVNYFTIDSGATSDTRPLLNGVVYNDANNNGLYDIGEGLGGVTVTISGVGSFTNWDAGGYSAQLNAGTYTVSFAGGGLPATITRTVTLANSNVRLNVTTGSTAVDQMASWVSLLYRDLLHRTAGTDEVTAWVGNLQRGLSRDFIVSAFLGSWEYNQNLVTGMFQHYLNRAPDNAGLTGFVLFLQNGGTESAVKRIFLSSGEFWNTHGGSADGFVQGLYQDLLGRSPTTAEAAPWVSILGVAGREGVADGFLNSREYTSQVVANLYQTYLRRSADDFGLNGMVDYDLAYHPSHYGVDLLLQSNEYFNGALSW